VTLPPDFSADPLYASVAEVTPAGAVDQDPLGMVYSFVADNSYPVRVMRLVRLPASCVIGEAECPEPEVIETPVELTSSLQPMAWSPKRYEAAWAYPINSDQRIWTLYLFNPADNSWKELAQFDQYMDPPMWSRDGNWLAFRLQDGKGGENIYAIRRDGSDMRILTVSDKLPAEGQPYIMDSWLGESAVLRSSKPGQTGTIYLMRVEDGKVTPMFETLLTKASFIESPDGTMLANVEYDYTSQKQAVTILTPDGQTFRELASFASGSIHGLAWSPDGRQLAFAQRTDASSSIYVIDSDGRNLRQVYISATDAQFIFSPDGGYLLAQTIDGTGEHLYAINLTTLEAHLVQAPGIGLDEAWMFPAWRK
jgi:Tol biopolymer transport system component